MSLNFNRLGKRKCGEFKEKKKKTCTLKTAHSFHNQIVPIYEPP